MNHSLEQIRQLLATYQDSLNTSNASLSASCYTTDGVFMPTTLQTATGKDLALAYSQIFLAIRLNIKFEIDELVVTSEDSAYALTRSEGTVTILATGDHHPEANRELFVFRLENGEWKIARYMFNKATAS